MFDGFFISSVIGSFFRGIKEAFEPTIPADNWANKELYHQDLMNGVSVEQRMKNVKNGRYKSTVKYPEPHRDRDGKICIENSQLFHDDLMKYGSVKTMEWVNQGKYNLTPEELKIEERRIKEKYEKLYSNLK